MLDVDTFGSEQTETKTKQFDEIGQIVVPRVLNDTKKIRKAGADIFATFGPQRPTLDRTVRHRAGSKSGRDLTVR